MSRTKNKSLSVGDRPVYGPATSDPASRWGWRAAPLMLVWIFFAQGVPIFEVNAVGSCDLSLLRTQITDNGDGDGFADTNETLQIGITLQPHCLGESADEGISDCVAWLSSESPAIDCMRRPEFLIGDIPGTGPAVVPEETFEIKVGSIDRQDLGLGADDRLHATLILDIRCASGSDLVWVQEELALPLDLNALDQGQTPVAWTEDFEAGGTNPTDPLQGTAFYAQNIDAGLGQPDDGYGIPLLGPGWRCQYSDPDWHNAASYNQAQGEVCYPCMNLAHANAVFWQIDGSLVAGTPDGGRAFRGEKSMYYGIFLGLADEGFTTPLSTVESVATIEPINLGVGSPQLSFWQQISLADERSINTRPGRAVDRGVAQIKLYDSADRPITDWMNLQPLQNSYAVQSETNYFNCMFDPIDDGNSEDDFFDPTDPGREFGPSSTCYPEFSWSFQGATTQFFSVASIGDGTTPPDLSDYPDHGLGTWLKSIVDLSEFRGRRARLRYIVTSLKGTAETHVGQFGTDRDERDDGWWIDDIVIDETLVEPAVCTNDVFLLGSCTGTGESCIGQCRSSLAPCSDTIPCGEGEGDCVIPCPEGEACAGPPPDCGANCTQAQVNLFVESNGPLNPESVTRNELGEQVTVNFAAPFDPGSGAQPSWVDVCIDGHKEYRACISGDPDGSLSGLPDADCDDAWDSPICESCSLGWSLTSTAVFSSDVTTTYAVEVRCSSVSDCRDGRTLEIIVECFGGNPNTYGLREMRALDKGMLTWRGALDVDWLRGSFVSGEEIGDYIADSTDAASHATSIPMDRDPPAGTGYYFLVKANGPIPPGPFPFYRCDTATWRSGGGAEMNEPARNNAFGNR